MDCAHLPREKVRGHGRIRKCFVSLQHVRFQNAHLHFQISRQGGVGKSVLDFFSRAALKHDVGDDSCVRVNVGDHQHPVGIESVDAEVHHSVKDWLIIRQVTQRGAQRLVHHLRKEIGTRRRGIAGGKREVRKVRVVDREAVAAQCSDPVFRNLIGDSVRR